MRWNSSFYMLKHILQQQQPLCAALLQIRKSELMPTDTEITAMETFLDVTNPIIQITEVMGAEKWVTLSAVRPLFHKLIHKHLVDAPSDSSLNNIKRAVLTDLQN